MSLSDLHLRIAESIRTLPGWRESPDPPTTFPRDPAASGHLHFAIELGAPTPLGQHEASRGRRPGGVGTWETSVQIRWTWLLSVEDGAASYRAMLDAEAELHDALSRLAAGPDSDPKLHLRLVGGGTRTPIGDGSAVLVAVPAVIRHPFAFHQA